tara:strand:+ start:774 stop:1124 length:351 start_codon:yes stop_codon:yes gene_type:complete
MSNLIGDIAEQRFIYDAISKGLEPLKPCRSGLPYDLVLNGRKVQVKSSSTTHTRKLTNSWSKGYRQSDVDFFAIWIKDIEKWLFIPWGIKSVCIPSQIKGRGKYSANIDNWKLFGQ